MQLTLIKHFTFNTLHSEGDKFPKGYQLAEQGLLTLPQLQHTHTHTHPQVLEGLVLVNLQFSIHCLDYHFCLLFFPPLSCFELWLLILLIWHLQTSFDIILIFYLFYLLRGSVNCMLKDTVKPVLRGQVRNKEKWPYKRDDLLNEVQFKWNCLWQDRKMWPVSACDCLIEVIAWTGLTDIS